MTSPTRPSRRRPGVAVVAAMLLVLVTGCGDVAAQGIRIAQVKATFVLNFIRFTTWPPDAVPADGPIVACVAGSDDVAQALEELVSQQAWSSRSVVVRRLRPEHLLDGCRLLYWSDDGNRRLRDLAREACKRPILTISDLPEFTERGGIAHLYVERDRMRFAVNPVAAERAQLRISSKLLSLARIVDAPDADTR